MSRSCKKTLASTLAWLFMTGAINSPAQSESRVLQFESQQKNPVAKNRPVSPPSKIRRYCRRLFRIYDKDADGLLKESEWKAMKGSPSKMDANRDGILTVREFAGYVFEFGRNRSIRLVDPDDEEILGNDTNQADSNTNQENRESENNDNKKKSTRTKRRTDTKFHIDASRLPSNLPAWFVEKDKNGDGQISLFEYSPRRTNTELNAFNALDVNKDGVITAREISRSGKKKKDSKN